MPCVKILSKAEYKTYLSDFHELDSNGSGLLEEKEVVILLTKQLGREPPQKMIDDFMRKVPFVMLIQVRVRRDSQVSLAPRTG